MGRGAEDVSDNLRREWHNAAMDNYHQSLRQWKVSFDDLITRSTTGGLVYSDKDKAAKFVSGLSTKWNVRKAEIKAMPLASR